VTAATIRGALAGADGVIVGSAMADGGVAGRPVDPDRVRSLVAAARTQSQD
jgi:predicted TIM-barrel enzyme